MNITCTRNVFGDAGTAKNETLKIKIKGLTNPRATNYKSYFKLYTMDRAFRYIDQNLKNQQFYVEMKRLKQVTSVTVDMRNKTNGAATEYEVTVIPSTQIHQHDVFKIQFPKEITLGPGIACGRTIRPLRRLSCQKVGEHSVYFSILDIELNHTAGVALKFTVANVTNAHSLRPSSTFSNMMFTDSQFNNDLTEFTKKVFVTTRRVGQISRRTAGLRQSSKDPDANATAVIFF